MAELSSGSVKIPGLGNGTDFSEMIDKLEQIEMKHAIQLGRWREDWQTRLDAFKQVRDAMVTYSTTLKEMNSIDKFLVKSVLNSNSSVCTVKASGDADNTSHTIQVKQKATNSYASIIIDVPNKLTSINDSGVEQTLEFSLGDPSNLVQVKVPPRCTLQGLTNIINQELGSKNDGSLGMRASIIDVGGQQMLQLYSTQTGEDTEIICTSGDGFLDAVGTWVGSAGQDALIRIDGWPTGDETDPANWLKLKNNSITHIPGLNITITGTGTTVIDVSLDTEAITENINKFVDATNELRTLLKELTDYDATKGVTSSDYAESQFETQKGGVLMGNYGMQLMMSKMKTLIFSKPAGFDYLVKDDDGNIISGDMFSSLAHIGIKTDDDQGSPTYGLLVFENNLQVVTGEGVEMITLEKALEMNAQGIAELFAANGEPSVDGYNFGHFSDMIALGVTKPGDYDVYYEVDGSGNVINATINGQACTYDPATSQLTVTGDGPAKGIVLDIYNKTATTPGNGHTGAIRLKSGFLPNLIQMIDSDFLDPDSGEQDSKKGTLSVLITQYQNIINNITTKIGKENERLILWRQREELRFSRLEATLKLYSGLQEQLEAQVKSLSSTSKK